jgi:hypothetical protein
MCLEPVSGTQAAARKREVRGEVGFKEGYKGTINEPGDFPGEAPQNTHILTALLTLGLPDVELGFRFERGCGVWFSGVPFVAERAGDAPPDAIANIYSLFCFVGCFELIVGDWGERTRR